MIIWYKTTDKKKNMYRKRKVLTNLYQKLCSIKKVNLFKFTFCFKDSNKVYPFILRLNFSNLFLFSFGQLLLDVFTSAVS